MLRVMDEISDPGGLQLNEDRVGSGGSLCWVIDGATSLEESTFLPAASDVQWLVDYVDGQLRELAAASHLAAGEHILALLKGRVTENMASLQFPADRVYPTCSIGLCLIDEASVQLIRVGDITCISNGDMTTELSTNYFSMREASAVRVSGRTGISADARAGILDRRINYIRGVEDESVFSGHPEGVLRSHSIQIGCRGLRHVLICSDGFARAITDYGLYDDWAAVVADAIRVGLDAVVGKIRDFERTEHGGTHFKRSDDASALLASLE
jgi:hypothetical protein